LRSRPCGIGKWRLVHRQAFRLEEGDAPRASSVGAQI